jgi:hypothetical protein
MDQLEFNTHSFIVKIWLEEPAEDNRRATWRGHITHVPSGERRYLKNLWQIVAFIAPYLIAMGVKLNIYLRLQNWLQRRREDQIERVQQPATDETTGDVIQPTIRSGG